MKTPPLRRLVVGILSVVGALAIFFGGTAAAQALSVITTIATPGPQPRLAVYDPAGSYAYVLDGTGVHKLDLATNTFVGNLSVGSAPFDMVISRDGHYIYVSNEGDHSITMINVTSWAVANTFVFTGSDLPCVGVGCQVTPRSLAISPDGNDLFVSNSAGTYIADLNVSNVIYATPRHWLDMGDQTWAMALSPDGTYLVVGSRNTNSMDKVNTPSLTGDWHQSLPYFADYLAFSPDGANFFVTSTGSSSVLKRDAATGGTTSPGIIGLLSNPGRIAFAADSSAFYVTSSTAGTLANVNIATMAATSTLAVGAAPSGVQGNAAGTDLMVMRDTADAVVRVGNPTTPTSTPALAATGTDQSQLPTLGWVAGIGMVAGALLIAAALWMRARSTNR